MSCGALSEKPRAERRAPSVVAIVFTTVEAPQLELVLQERKLNFRLLKPCSEPVKNATSTMKRLVSWFLLLLAAILLTEVRASSDLCPSSCTCANDGAIVDCSRQGLTRIPSNLPSNTVTL